LPQVPGGSVAEDSLNRELLELLAWYGEIGVDCAVAGEPQNWLDRGDRGPGAGFELAQPAATTGKGPDPRPVSDVALPPPATAAAATGMRRAPLPVDPLPGAGAPAPADGRPRTVSKPALQTVAPRPAAAVASDPGVTAARRLARDAQTLDELGRAIASFDGCGLKATAKNLCFYRGSPAARLMIIGEAPGREEDLAGQPFVGPAGRLLDKMLAAIGLAETDIHVTNTVYWRPPGNRPPTPQEIEVCRPFLERQIELVSPAVLLLLGIVLEVAVVFAVLWWARK
jgi:DNA polymerase